MNDAETPRPRRSIATSAVIVAVLAGAATVLAVSGGIETPSAAAAKAAPPARKPVTVEVEHMVLVDKLVTRGTVQSAGALEYSPPSSTAGSSRLEVLRAPGETVNAGDAVALVDGRPVLLLTGPDQLGADVRPTSVGRDVERLQAGLRGIGLTIDAAESGKVGPTTQAAITTLYERAGFRVDTTTEPTGGMTGGSTGGESLDAKLSRLRRAVADAQSALTAAEASAAALPDPVAAALLTLDTARRKVTEAEATRSATIGDALEALASARAEAAAAATSTTTTTIVPGNTFSATGTSPASTVAAAEKALRDAQRLGDAAVADAQAQVAAAQQQLDAAQRSDSSAAAQARQQVSAARSALTAAQETLAESQRQDGVVLPRAEVLFVPSLPTTVLTVGATSSPTAQPGGSGPLFTLRSGAFVVAVDVPAGVRVRDGAVGVAESDDGSVSLEIAAPTTPAASEATPSSSDPTLTGAVPGSTSGTSFDITATTRGEATAGSNLRVSLSTPVTTDEVVAVPLRAIATDDAGRSYVRVAVGNDFREVEVRAGRTGSGMVELLAPDGGAVGGVSPGDRVRVS